MAIARCERHTPTGTKHNYRAYALPIGFPETAAICGRVGCEESARVWLTNDDQVAFQRANGYLILERTQQSFVCQTT